MSTEVTLDIDVPQATNFDVEFDWKNPVTFLPVDLIDYDAYMQIRPRPQDTTILAEFSSKIGNIQLNADGMLGVVRVKFTPNDTAEINWSRGFYDLYLVNEATGIYTRLAKGQVTVLERTTVAPAVGDVITPNY